MGRVLSFWRSLTTRPRFPYLPITTSSIATPRYNGADIDLGVIDLTAPALEPRWLAEGLPYQTLISSLLHKYASGRLREV